MVEIQWICFLAEELGGAVMTQGWESLELLAHWGSSKLQGHGGQMFRVSHSLSVRWQDLRRWLSFLPHRGL